MELLEKWLPYKLMRLRIFSSSFWVFLIFSVQEILKNSKFETALILQSVIINNYRTTSANFMNLSVIRNLMKYSLKNVWQNLLLKFYRYCYSKVGLYWEQNRRFQGGTRLEFQWKENKDNVRILLELFENWLPFKLRKFSTIFKFS